MDFTPAVKRAIGMPDFTEIVRESFEVYQTIWLTREGITDADSEHPQVLNFDAINI